MKNIKALMRGIVTEGRDLSQRTAHSGQIQKAYGMEVILNQLEQLERNLRSDFWVIEKVDVILMQDEIAALEDRVRHLEAELEEKK